MSDFRSNKNKSGSSIIIAYHWPMTLKVGYGSGVVTAMNLRGQLSKLRVPLNILLAHITGKSFGLLVISYVKRATLNL